MTGRQVSVLDGPRAGTDELLWGPSGLLLARAYQAAEVRDQATLWDMAAGKVVAWPNPGERIEAFAGVARPRDFSVVTLERRRVTVRDARTGETVAAIPLPPGALLLHRPTTFARTLLSPDGTRIAIPFGDCSLRVRELAGEKGWRVLRGHSGSVDQLAWSPDGQHIATSSGDQTLRIWSSGSAEEEALLRMAADTHASLIAWGPDATRIAVGLQKNSHDWGVGPRLPLFVWDFRTRQEVHFPGPGTDTFAWSPDGKYLALASPSDVVEIRDAETGDLVNRLRGHTPGLLALSWSPDGTRLATGGYDGTVRVWDAFAPPDASIHRGATAGDLSGHLSWSPDWRRLAVTSPGRTIKVLDGASAREIRALTWPAWPGDEAGEHATCVAWSPDGRHLAAAGTADTVVTWDAESLEIRHLNPGGGHWISWSPDGKYLASKAGKARSSLWNPLTGEAERTISVGPFSSLSYDPRLLTAWNPATGRFDFVDGRVVQELGPGPAQPVIARSVAGLWELVSPDGTWAVAWGGEQRHLLNRSGDAGTREGIPIPGEALAASRDGRFLLAHTHVEDPRGATSSTRAPGKRSP